MGRRAPQVILGWWFHSDGRELGGENGLADEVVLREPVGSMQGE